MNEFWDKVIDEIDEKYVGEAASAYLEVQPEEKRLIRISKTETEKKKSHKGLMALGIAAAAVMLTAAVTLGVGLLGKNREIPVLSAPEVPLYGEEYVSPEELYYFTKSETFFNYDGREYFKNNSYNENCFFRMDSEGVIYETIDYYDKTECFSLRKKIKGINNINELEEINGVEFSEHDYRFYILPDKRIVGVKPYSEEEHQNDSIYDTEDLYQADFFYCNENITAIEITKTMLSEITNYPNLKKLKLWSNTVDGLKTISEEDINAFKSSAAYSSIEILALDSCVNLPAEIIKGMPALREITMDCSKAVNMSYMQSLPHLKSVVISGNTIDLRGIKELRELRTLDLSVDLMQAGTETADVPGFEELAEIPSLKELTLVGSVDAAKLSLLKNIEKLSVYSTVKNLSFINDMTSLKEIFVNVDTLIEFGLSADNYTVEKLTILSYDSIVNLEELKRFKAIKEVNISGSMAITNKPRTERIISEFGELYPEAKINIEINYSGEGVANENIIRALERAVLPENPDMAEIERLLSDFREFSYDYLNAKTAKKHIGADFIESDEIIYNGNFIWRNETPTKWYKLVSGEITTQDDLFVKLYQLFNSEGIGCLGLDDIYRANMGELYLSENAGNDGGVLGVDEVWLSGVEREDDYTLSLSFSVFGDKDNWECLEDFTDSFNVTLENTTEGLRISDIDLMGIDYLTWFPVDFSRYGG